MCYTGGFFIQTFIIQFMAAPLSLPNQYFSPADEEWIFRALPMKASTAIAMGTIIATEISASNPTGNFTAAGTTNANGANYKGILMETIAATDADYATAGKLKLVAIPLNPQSSKAFFTVGSGTFTAADVGRICATAGSGTTVAVDTNGLGVEITDYISSTQGKCVFSVPYAVTA